MELFQHVLNGCFVIIGFFISKKLWTILIKIKDYFVSVHFCFPQYFRYLWLIEYTSFIFFSFTIWRSLRHCSFLSSIFTNHFIGSNLMRSGGKTFFLSWNRLFLYNLFVSIIWIQKFGVIPSAVSCILFFLTQGKYFWSSSKWSMLSIITLLLHFDQFLVFLISPKTCWLSLSSYKSNLL